MLHPAEHQELAAGLREAQSRGDLQDVLMTLKGAMDAKGLHYEDLSGRPKNLCVFHPTVGDSSGKLVTSILKVVTAPTGLPYFNQYHLGPRKIVLLYAC